ncbi:hypothetical protein ACIQCJ_01970 [Streptomyces sp. NPDC093221]|uniref:hypothetical protein n=1 Tax=Streptomyces sp. NPDC093221 TaxID=3366032 RepID=UPI00381981EC
MNKFMASQPHEWPNGAIRRHLCIAADVEKYSHRDIPSQATAQHDLVGVLEEATALSGLDRAGWIRQAQGDQELSVLPADVSEAVVLGTFTKHLSDRLGIRNASRPPRDRMRLRLAIDTGVAALAALGHAGPAPIAVARYLNAPQLRAVLEKIFAADLAVIVSGRLYEDVVKSRCRGLDPDQYVRAHVRQKEFSDYGWIQVPGRHPDEVRAVVESLEIIQSVGPGRREVAAEPSSGKYDRSQWVGKGIAIQDSVVGRDLNFGVPSVGSDGRSENL